MNGAPYPSHSLMLLAAATLLVLAACSQPPQQPPPEFDAIGSSFDVDTEG